MGMNPERISEMVDHGRGLQIIPTQAAEFLLLIL
jgi:hypothetical protein